MRGFSSSVVVVVVMVGVSVGAGCQPGRAPHVPPCETTPGEVVDSGANTFDPVLQPLPTRFEIVLGEDAGGPLRCVPGTGECAACEGARVDVAVGEATTLAVDARNGFQGGAGISMTVTLTGGSDPAFQLLQPVPEAVFDEPAPIFVSVAPVDVGAIDAFLSITASALNTTGRPPVLVGLHVNAIAP